MQTTMLAHGGQITGDEMAIIGVGLFAAMGFPVVALLIAMRRSRRRRSGGVPGAGRDRVRDDQDRLPQQ